MKYRNELPQTTGTRMLTDGGLETVLIFDHGIDLPEFAAFPLLEAESGRALLSDYLDPYVEIAKSTGHGLALEASTWRANPDWGHKLGYDQDALAKMIRLAIDETSKKRVEIENDGVIATVSGCIGPRGDGYSVDEAMTATEAEQYHAYQIGILAETEADLVTAMTLNYTNEAVGILKAARQAGMPAIISFTVETDGRLPDGESLASAIATCDQETDGYATFFMINCAHPSHFQPMLEAAAGSDWTNRIGGVRVNASTMSHAELDEAEELDEGEPEKIGREVEALLPLIPQATVFGGCCGTDQRHLRSIGTALAH